MKTGQRQTLHPQDYCTFQHSTIRAGVFPPKGDVVFSGSMNHVHATKNIPRIVGQIW